MPETMIQHEIHIFPVVLLACFAQASGSELAKPGFPQPCGMQLKTHNFDKATLDKVHKLGFRVVRCGFYWTTIEKETGIYDFSKYDARMAHANKKGLTVIGVMFGNNKLYEDDGQGGIQTKAVREGRHTPRAVIFGF